MADVSTGQYIHCTEGEMNRAGWGLQMRLEVECAEELMAHDGAPRDESVAE